MKSEYDMELETETEPETDSSALAKRAWSKLEALRFVQLTTSDGRGQLAGRPMTLQQIDDETLWFFTSRSTELAESIQRDPRVNVCSMDVKDSFYLSISGTAHLVDDRAKVRELWSFMVKAWFPGGADDPDLALVRVDITQAEVWNSEKSQMQQFLSMAKAALTGTPPKKVGDHAVIAT